MPAEVELRMLEGSEFQTVGGCNAKIALSKGCADTSNRQKIGVVVGKTQRACGSVIIE